MNVSPALTPLAFTLLLCLCLRGLAGRPILAAASLLPSPLLPSPLGGWTASVLADLAPGAG